MTRSSLPHERRDALSRERLSGADGAAGLGGQHVVRSGCAASRPAITLAHPARRPRNTPTCWRTARRGAHLFDGGEVRHHQSEPAGADQSQVRLHRAVRHCVVRPRQDRARGRLARRRTQLAGGEDRRAFGRQGAGALLSTSSIGTAATLLLPSRAMDETGYVQPGKAELRKYRGVNSIYHNNGIQTWHYGRTARLRMSKSLKRTLLAAGILAIIGAGVAAAPKAPKPAPHAEAQKHLGIGARGQAR